MSALLKKHAHLLKVLAHAKPQMCKAIVQAADKNLIICLCECAQNLLKGNVPLSKAQLKKLKQYRKEVRTLAQKRTSQSKRKEILQKGGFLPALLAPIALTVLGTLLN